MKKTVLVIDDDVLILRTLKDIIENSGYDVVTLEDPSKAEDYIERFLPSVMIIDIFMPGRSGFDLIEDFRNTQKYENIPKIFLTCLDDDIERMTARARGVERYITKPFSPDEIIKCVNEIVIDG